LLALPAGRRIWMGEETVAIIGGGKFGLQALLWAFKTHHKALVFDSDAQALVRNHVHAILPTDQKWTLEDLTQAPSVLVLGNAIDIAIPILQDLRPAYVIPTIPVHFLAASLLFIARQNNQTYVPDADEIIRIAKQFTAPLNASPNPQEGIIALSYAQPGELCPPQCTGPLNFCPTFKREKKKTITILVSEATKQSAHRFLAESQQLTNGLGGILGSAFFHILDQFRETLPPTFVVSTTCNCHGVLQAFKRKA